jgi:uncharacterized protein (TIGR03435 family)
MSDAARPALAVLALAAGQILAQSPAPRPPFESFDVATIKPAEPTPGRYFTMRGAHQFLAKNFTLTALVAAAYNLNPQRQISGAPAWTSVDVYDILAAISGAVRPNQEEQMRMLRKLLTDRFKLSFHYQQKEMSIYALTIAAGGSKLQETGGPPGRLPDLVSVVFPDHIMLPARNATMAQFIAMLRRGWLDRPVIDQTGLTGRYDFDLEWTPEQAQFAAEVNAETPGSEDSRPELFEAMRQQLGLKIKAIKGPAEIMIIDHVEKPGAN